MEVIGDLFIELTWSSALTVVALGFIGGTLSGFIGSGGAFFMTPGMMNLGVSGIVAVGSNITHKFGKAVVGARRHARLGNVDRKLGLFLIMTAFLGVWLAGKVNHLLFEGGTGKGQEKSAGADLYISAIFIFVLTFVAVSMLRDALRRNAKEEGPSRVIAEFLGRLNLRPLIKFPVADVELSLWIILPVGLATGYLAGTIGVGGFIGVPAMIYIFGVPTAVAAGTELFLAIFMGATGAIYYALQGYVDLRLTLLLYLGSLLGVYIGAYGVKLVRERYIRLVTGLVILGCVLSRAINVPVYLRKLELVPLDARWDPWLNRGSTVMLFLAGGGGAGLILYSVLKAHLARRRIHTTLLVSQDEAIAQEGWGS